MKICILTIGTRGDVQPYIALGLGLNAVGHEVTIATLAEFGSLVKEYGLQYAGLRGDFLKAAQEAQSNSSTKQRTNPLQLIRQYTAMAKDTLRDEWESAKNTEVFIYNPAAIGAYDIAERLNVPAFSAFPTPLYSPTKEFPSPFFPFRNLGSFNKLSHKVFAKMGPAIYRRPVNEWRREVLGLPPAKGGEALRGKPVTKLYAYSEAIVPRPLDWDESSVVTGYWFLDAPRTWQPEPALVKFLSDGPPPVYIGFGSMSMFSSADKSDLVLEALKLAGQRAVLAGVEGGTTMKGASKSILHIHAVPHDWLFPQIAAIVHHGGAGTTGASLRAGKPTVICPFVGDQTFWGNRVAALRVGPSPISKSKLTAKTLAQAIRRAITDEPIRARAASLGHTIRAEDGVGNAVALISSRL